MVEAPATTRPTAIGTAETAPARPVPIAAAPDKRTVPPTPFEAISKGLVVFLACKRHS